jgi:2',3'-cyclic-nucleotide 2'-phosphodiesterase (5'-nucleotidase family)
MLAAVLLSACSLGQQTITILHTNDMHANFAPHQAFWIKSEPKPMVGGFNELAYMVDSIRAANPSTLLLDAGDVMTGNPISDVVYNGAEGGALFEMMNRIGYDASCPGNHDFDISQKNLRALIGTAKFPSLSANLVDNEGKFPVGNKDYVIIERAGLRIGIIGVMSQGLYGLVFQENLTGIRVLSPVETTQKLVNALKPKTDLLIALTHQGVDDDDDLAKKVTGLDVIVGGHSHTRLKNPKSTNGVVIVQAGSDCENLGILNLTIENKKVVRFDGQLLQLWANDAHRSHIAPFVDSLKTEIDKAYSEVIATLKEDWKRGNGETNIGNFVAGAMAEAAGAEIGITNTHGLRKDVPAGPLTRRDIYEVLPFRNLLATFQISGGELRSILTYYLSKKTAIQITGVACQYKRTPDGIEFITVDVDGRPLDDKKKYVCATSDFFVGQAKGYIGMEIPQPIYLRDTMFGVVEKAARKAESITTKVDNRFREVH